MADKIKQIIEEAISEAKNDKKIKLDWQVVFYADLMKIIEDNNMITPVTRFAIERYYGMNVACLSEIWKEGYFKVANICLNSPEGIDNIDLNYLI